MAHLGKPPHRSFTIELVCKGVNYLASAKTMKRLLQKKKALFLKPCSGKMVSGQRLAGTRYWRREVRVRQQGRLVPLTTYLDDIVRARRRSDGPTRPLPPAHAAAQRHSTNAAEAAGRRCAAPTPRTQGAPSPHRHRTEASIPARHPKRPDTAKGESASARHDKGKAVSPPTRPVSAPRNDLNCCCVCQDAKMDAALVPCSHVCACQGCAAKLLSLEQGCPVCRLDIENYIKVYIC
jgi:Zinc finger, C3HC4 type (RING finger)